MMASRAMAMLLLAAPLAHAGTNEAGKKFLAEKAKEDGVIVLESGLMYKVLRKGDGAYHPTADSSCSCHYGGKLITGETFDSSYDRGSPTDFAPNQVIKGWTEAMQLMVEGDKWEMYIPSELGYGENGSPPKIQGGDALVFQMELLEIKGDKVEASKCDPTNNNENCSEQEVKYIEKLQASTTPEQLKELMDKITEADLPEVGKKGKKVMSAFMRKDLGIKLKNGKLSSKWYQKIKKIITKMVAGEAAGEKEL
jgi:FKBP-type peptidyl-prolyl cis-trans isomerase FklB